MIKRIISLLIITLLCSVALVGCNDDGTPDGMFSVTVAGEPFTLFVPDGWTDNRDSGISSAYFGLNVIATARAYAYENANETLAGYVDAYIEDLKQTHESFSFTRKDAALGKDTPAVRLEYDLSRQAVDGAGNDTDSKLKTIQYISMHSGEAIVLSIDGRYIAVEGGEVVTEGIDADTASAAVEAAREYVLVTHEGLTEAELPEGVDASVAHSVTKIWSAPRGGYVFELRAAGYGILGGSKWHPASGEYITIKLAIDAQGRIISTLTVYENESDGIGDACADPEYYEQYNGKDGASVDEVLNISGATITSDGYKKAVKNAFAVFELLSGGEENE